MWIKTAYKTVYLIIYEEGAVAVLERGVGVEHGVVGLHYGGADLRGRVDREGELGFFPIVYTDSLQQKGTEPGAGAAAEAVEHQEALQAARVVRQSSQSVHRNLKQTKFS